MNRPLACAIPLMVAVTVGAKTVPMRVCFDTAKDIQSAALHLKMCGIERFVMEAVSNGIDAPGIRSKYWVDQFASANPAVKDRELALRDFGYEIALQLDRLAVDIAESKKEPNDLDRLEWLLCFKEWIVEPGRYENFRLAARAENAAMMPLLRAIVDMDVQDEAIEKAFARFVDEKESAKLRANILYDESGGLFDLRSNLDAVENQEWLVSAWWTPKAKKSGERYGRRMMRYMYDFDLLNKDSVENNFFYTDDDRVYPRNLSNNWDNKEHKLVCAYKIKADGIDALRRVYEFRKAARRFPDVNVPDGKWPRHVYEDYYDTVFQKEKAAGLLPRLAAAYYLKCKTNTFIDRETAETIDYVNQRGLLQYEPHVSAVHEILVAKRRRENEKWLAGSGIFNNKPDDSFEKQDAIPVAPSAK